MKSADNLFDKHRYGPGDDSVIAFTPFGIENLQELIEMDRDGAR